MQLIESKRCFVPFRNEVSEFLIFKFISFNRSLIRKVSESKSYLNNPNYSVNIPCGKKPEYPEKTHDVRQSVDQCNS